jgi:hypothetical protein
MLSSVQHLTMSSVAALMPSHNIVNPNSMLSSVPTLTSSTLNYPTTLSCALMASSLSYDVTPLKVFGAPVCQTDDANPYPMTSHH